MNNKRVVLAGGTGFIGQILARELQQQGWDVIVLTRNLRERDAEGIQEVEWDGEHVGEWIQYLEDAEAVINLSGGNINCRHTPDNLREILDSRVNSVQAISGGIFHVKRPPRLWLQAGAIGFYGNRHDEWCNERSSNGPGRLADVCRRWEEAFFSTDPPKTRRILFRIGIVLGAEGGALPVLANYTRWFLGGAAGTGRQYISWIHHADLTQMFLRALVFDNYLAGTYNAVAPNPATNAEFMRALRHALYRPWSPPVPAWLVKLACKLTQSEPSLALEGCRCAPKRFLESGFEYKFPDLRGALKDICR
ncbi:MAG: TIGR01777 family oxidoreductase [Verrucomicrobiia bacterium]